MAAADCLPRLRQAFRRSGAGLRPDRAARTRRLGFAAPSRRRGRRPAANCVLPFDDDTGQRWWLQGAEHVERARALAGDVGAGLALTRPQERYDGLMPTGRATIAFRDALRLATTLRPVGTRSPAGWWCDQPVAR